MSQDRWAGLQAVQKVGLTGPQDWRGRIESHGRVKQDHQVSGIINEVSLEGASEGGGDRQRLVCGLLELR